jgi:2-haloacid dehalogenase
MRIKALVFDAYGTLYDTQSVSAVTDRAFPGRGEYITQLWRMKQLEYTWLRSMMGRYEDFWTITRDALSYTLATLGLEADEAHFEAIAQAYNQLSPYPDAEDALTGLGSYRRAIFSNGSPAMLGALTRHSGFDRHLETVMSVDAKRIFKPDPRAYELVEETMGVSPDEVLLVSSNGFDVSGAKSFGFKVARIERVSPAALSAEIAAAPVIGPQTMFKAVRMQSEALGWSADYTIGSLKELPALAASWS